VADDRAPAILAPGVHPLNAGWRLGPAEDAAPGEEVTLPHVAVPLGWRDWEPETWQRRWTYRRSLPGPPPTGHRVFADFQGVMTSATVSAGGVTLATHRGGFLPFSVELTAALAGGAAELEVVVDATQQDVPPASVADGPDAIDFLTPGGIHREVALRVVPEGFVADIWARPRDVLTGPRLEVSVTLEGPAGDVAVELLDGDTVLAASRGSEVVLDGLAGIELWSPEHPRLYVVRVRAGDHVAHLRTGFREAVFETGGFFLNGARRQIFGLNRHELFPHLGMAAPARLQRRDAERLKALRCNMVRCSHYPQSPAFLDACDELGLMVWEETPGWQHVGGEAFHDLVRENVADMIRRDRHRPSVIVWGTRVNESASTRANQALYADTAAIARELDGTRATSGAMDRHSTRRWDQDLFAFDDYGSVGGRHREATLRRPVRGVPYLVSEAVGALSGAPLYRWVDPPRVLALQAEMHARVHDLAGRDGRYAGLLGWCAIDYPSRNGGERIWRAMKWAGVLDGFRVAKPAAGIYAAQVDPEVQAVIVPGFAWDDAAVRRGLIATNCDQLRLVCDGAELARVSPERDAFPGLAHPPAFVDLPAPAGRDLSIEGLVAGAVAVTVSMSSDRARDALELTLEDAEIVADGADATRFTLRAVDAFGHLRRGVAGDVALAVSGPARLIASDPFPLGDAGGVGGGYLRSRRDEAGEVQLRARHPTLGSAVAQLRTVI
jgi:beta-galactosidase